MLEGFFFLVACVALGMAGWFALYHYMTVNRKPRRLYTTNELGGLPPPIAPFIREAPVDPDKADWDARLKAWEKLRAEEAAATIAADDPDLYDVLEKAAEEGRRHV
jgi:hypothetical protein